MFTLGKTLAGSALALMVTHTWAAPVSLPQNVTTTLGSNWNITNTGGTSTGSPFSGSCSSLPGLTIRDAQSTTGDNDMYDNAWSVWIDGSIFVAPNPVDLTGNTLTAGPVSMSGLNATMQYYFADNTEAIRTLVTLANPTGSVITVSLDIANNFGSDGSTTIVDTSSGDTIFTVADGWVTTWDGGSEINTTVFTIPGGVLAPTSVTDTVFNCAGTQGFGASFSVTVPAGAEVSLAFFGGIAEIDGTGDSNPANAVALAVQFENLLTISADLTSGLSPEFLSNLLNVSSTAVVVPPPAPAPIPVMPYWALLILSGLMSLVGLSRYKARRN